ncbi:MAG: hypothetical protein ACT4PZ_17360 [Panacagrimonas sp.]
MNKDDDFFKLPRARNPLRRAPDGGSQPEAVGAGASDSQPPSPPTAPRKRRWLWPAFAFGALGLVVVGGLLGYWAFMNIAARLMLTDQPVRIRLPETASIVLKTTNDIDVLMKGVITAQVPLQQTLNLPVKGTYDTIITLDTKVPLETTIVYEGVIPIDTIADIEAKAPVNFQNVKKYKNLHFKAKLPMKLNLPVKLVVPVKQDIPFKYRGPLKVQIDHVIRAPVGTTLNTALKVNQEFRVPIISTLPVSLQLPQHPVKATIVEADLNLDLATLRLERKPAEAAAR